MAEGREDDKIERIHNDQVEIFLETIQGVAFPVLKGGKA